MFNCKTCNKVIVGDKEFRIPSIVRSIRYMLQVKPDTRGHSTEEQSEDKEVVLRTIDERKGFEIVKEDTYCRTCVPKDHEPIILKEEVIKYMLVKRKNKKKYNKQKRDNDNEQTRENY